MSKCDPNQTMGRIRWRSDLGARSRPPAPASPTAHTLHPNGPARLARASLAKREAQCQSQHDTNAASRDADVPELFHDPLQNFNVPASSCHANGGKRSWRGHSDMKGPRPLAHKTARGTFRQLIRAVSAD